LLHERGFGVQGRGIVRSWGSERPAPRAGLVRRRNPPPRAAPFHDVFPASGKPDKRAVTRSRCRVWGGASGTCCGPVRCL